VCYASNVQRRKHSQSESLLHISDCDSCDDSEMLVMLESLKLCCAYRAHQYLSSNACVSRCAPVHTPSPRQ
jgi:hypothetical protein